MRALKLLKIAKARPILNELFSGSPGQQRRADVQQTLADMDARSEGFWVEPDNHHGGEPS